ncbi:uncharacterized protein PpBr36_06649 [Pyricularia pennisetigena]|uniref:uncharacterized protein n=1 Tax=Pyricularia pennisetigena TaxID=1578925 RepID=UPI00115390E4|nr:uncharacterized protein PpBr36_06649 [Pyricularia pennisetigena]TLS23762.1 hypothetical protein PpBr36_06649 [Pyricularia pennisetigena]
MIQLSRLPWGLRVSLLAALAQLQLFPLASGAPSVEVSMQASFQSPPYLLELLETAAQENGTAYFPLLDRIASGHFAKANTDRELYEKFLQVLQEDGHITSPDALSTFKLALSMRSAAPRIEAHYQHYRTAVEPKLQGKVDNCPEWILKSGEIFCSVDEAKGVANIVGDVLSRDILFDQQLGDSSEGVVLYADITSPSFGAFHDTLATAARNGGPSYRLRHRSIATASKQPLYLSGYGVELALKRTDYIVIDDRANEKTAQDDSAQKPLVGGSSEIVLNGDEEVADLKPLSASELEQLGLKAADFILRGEKPFETLLKLTQDFPKYSGSVSAHNVSAEFRTEHNANRMVLQIPSGSNILWMNGVQLIERQIQSFGLVDVLRRERQLINEVRDLGLSGREAVDLLSHSDVASSKANDEPPRFDWRDEKEDGKVIVWLNNLEKDKRYESYSPHIMTLLSGGMPGQLPPIRRNIFNIVLPVDFSKASDLALATSQLIGFVKQRIPIRFGLVPLAFTPEAEGQAKVVYHLLQTYGLSSLMAYLESCLDGSTAGANQEAFDAAIKDRAVRSDSTALSLKEVLESDAYTNQVTLAKQWSSRLGAHSAVPPLFVNGFALPRDLENRWMGMMSGRISSDLRSLQEGIYYGTINDETSVIDIFLEGASSRRNHYIFPENSNGLTILDINKVYTDHDDLFSKAVVIESSPDSTKEAWALLTVLVDLDSKNGREILLSALKFRRINPGVRLEIVHNAVQKTSHDINSNLKEQSDRLLAAESDEGLVAILDEIRHAPQTNIGLEYAQALERFQRAAHFEPGNSILMLNGRVVGPIESASEFGESDFQTFLEFEQNSRIIPVYKALEELGLGDRLSDPVAAAKLTSITALSTISDLPDGAFENPPTLRISSFKLWNSTHTGFEVGDPSKASIFFTAVIDPASELGQKWTPLLKVLSELEGVHLKVFMNPRDRLEELPVKRFYRFVMDSAPAFDEAGKLKVPSASFKGLPSEALLNLGMDVPPAWLVAPKVSVHDLDNIKLSSVTSDVTAIYELENILIEGHARSTDSGTPRGVQLVLGTDSNPRVADTIIMANLGYLQFKANPGIYDITLEKGRSSDIFYVESIGAHGFSPVPGDETTEVALLDFLGTTLYPRLRRNPGKEDMDVLEESGAAPSGTAGGAMDFVNKGLKFAESILGTARGKAKEKSPSELQHAEINIFSVASGHLYERMLDIMMVSVMRNTNHTVKFWFIEQFLSPSFKDFIPHMAAEYGFKYEMVTYKWPHWLRQQKEKQREIWGYKILFLDVLFPLTLDKVIFVDADQIVRTDMYELVQLDLQGAPYGFTPMCDSRTEMEGFRFWKHGYWERYLKGLPYHISALYVVDLRRFRELAAGDRLRQTYHSLSADPNSLSNLDQDLPNHMQFSIPIFSLPQEWLWCETWCSDETQPMAKTIDLCNNPMTKEPKLDRARRQVPEWNIYDAEIAALDRKRKGLPVSGDAVSEKAEKNPKSRTLAVEPENTHIVDEL